MLEVKNKLIFMRMDCAKVQKQLKFSFLTFEFIGHITQN